LIPDCIGSSVQAALSVLRGRVPAGEEDVMVPARIPADGPVRLGSVQLPDGRQLSDGYADPPLPLLWATSEPVPDAPRVWQVLTGMHPDTGLVPILLSFMRGGHEGRPWDAGELDMRCDLAAVDGLDAASVLAEVWAGKAPTLEDFERQPEFFADWFPPVGSEFPGLAPGQDQALTEAELDRALSWPGPARPGSAWYPLPAQPTSWPWPASTGPPTGTAPPSCCRRSCARGRTGSALC
jgi:hypothetical protein